MASDFLLPQLQGPALPPSMEDNPAAPLIALPVRTAMQQHICELSSQLEMSLRLVRTLHKIIAFPVRASQSTAATDDACNECLQRSTYASQAAPVTPPCVPNMDKGKGKGKGKGRMWIEVKDLAALDFALCEGKGKSKGKTCVCGARASGPGVIMPSVFGEMSTTADDELYEAYNDGYAIGHMKGKGKGSVLRSVPYNDPNA